jgi:hypothetical protein
MKIQTGIVCLALYFISFSPVFGQNRITLELEEFNELHVTGGIDVELIPSGSKEMSITSRKGFPEQIQVNFKERELHIKVRPRIVKEDEISIRLPYSQLVKIDAAAGAVITSARDMKVKDIDLVASSGGKIELSLDAQNINAKVVQVSDIVLYGTAVSQNVSANTGGNYLAYDLECQDTYVNVSSGSQAKLTASRIIEASASSKGFIGYIGDPVRTNLKTSLGGEVLSYKTKADALAY